MKKVDNSNFIATNQARTAYLVGCMAAVCMAVKEGGNEGAPGGILYAGLSVNGMTFANYERLMESMVKGGLLNKGGDCYTLTDAGELFLPRIC